MYYFKRFFIACLMLTTSAASAAISITDKLAKLPDIAQMQISPDGKTIAYLQTIDEKFFIVTSPVNNKSKPKVFGIGNGLIRSFEWLTDERILFRASFTKFSKGDQETFTFMRAGLLDVDESEAIWPFGGSRFLYNIGGPKLISKLANEPNHIIMSNYYRSAGSGTVTKLYKIDIEDGDKDEHFYSSNNRDWILNDDGDVIFVEKYDKRKEKYFWHFRQDTTQDFKILQSHVDSGLVGFQRPNLVHFDSKKSTLYYFEDNERGLNTLVKSKLNNHIAEESTVVLEDNKYDITGALYDYNSSVFLGASYVKNFKKSRYMFSTLLNQVQLDLEATFEDNTIVITSYSQDKSRFIVRVTGAKTPEAFFFYDRKVGRLEQVISSYAIKGAELSQTELFGYQTEDNFTIDGYFTPPQSFTGDLPPLIVLPHGGPEARDTMDFDWIRAAFSINGYAVYQPNFRGSSGYGTKFTEAGYGQWGMKMQTDIDDGVKQLIAQKKVDPSRICIVGASYGGYAALIGATKQPDMYKCAVSFGGVSDLDGMFYHNLEQLRTNTYWEKSIGKRTDRETLHRNSPKNLISSKTSPILLIHGDKDTVVPPFQSKVMYKQLKKRGVKGSRHIEIENADHWFSTTKSRQIFINESLRFVNKHL